MRAEPDDSTLYRLRLGIERACRVGDTSAAGALESELLRIVSADHLADPRPWLYLGSIHSFLGMYWMEEDDDRAKNSFETAEKYLSRAVGFARPEEVYALQALCAGNLVRYTSFFGRIGQGRKAGRYLDRALEADSLNPRVALVQGVSLMYRPAVFGGGADKARLGLYRAIGLRRAYSHLDSLTVDWGGEAEIYAWLAELELREGNLERAREFAGIVERLDPEYWFLHRRVLPELRKAARGKP